MVVGRLAPGVTIDTARDDIARLVHFGDLKRVIDRVIAGDESGNSIYRKLEAPALSVACATMS